MQLRTLRASRQRSRAPAPHEIAHRPEPFASTQLSVVGAAIALTLAAMGACSSSAEDLFGESTGTTEGAGASSDSSNSGGGSVTGSGGGSVTGSGGGNATTSSTTSTSASSTSASSTSGTGGAGTGGAGTGGADNPMCGDDVCNGDETNQTCPQDCDPVACGHPVCETGDKLVPGCDPCVDTVCADDAFCCNDNWDGACVGKADSLCGAGCCGDGACNGESCDSCPQDCGTCPPDPTCPHSVCAVAGPLNTTDCYDPCVSQTCAADASCCQGSPPAWDGDCVALAKMTCGPDPCITAVCTQDPTCCAGNWTQDCVDLAKTACNVECSCAHSICTDAEKLPATCNPCATAVCAVDPYCCDNAWDGYCVNEVSTICGIICN